MHIHTQPGRARRSRVSIPCRPGLRLKRHRNEIDERPHARRELVAPRIDCINVRIRRAVLGQYLDEAAAAQIALDVPFGAHEDAVTVERPVHRDLAVVGRERAADLAKSLGTLGVPLRAKREIGGAARLRLKPSVAFTLSNPFVQNGGLPASASAAERRSHPPLRRRRIDR